MNEKQINLAHIFVHFFQIGGGERYLSNFNNYNKINKIFNETIFVNKNHNNNSLFNFDNISYYNDYEELNNLLKNYDLIIDHQLYWFDTKYSKIAFNEIPINKIVRITHGVPIHFQNINELNYYYSIELYNEMKSHISWNNHIKIYNNIGIDIDNDIDIDIDNLINKKIKFNTKQIINIAIVGRINNEKIPVNFIKVLLTFIKIHKNYVFNFYGTLDDSYKTYFLTNIYKDKINKDKDKDSKDFTFSSGNIKYHGIIEPKYIENIYLTNDILLHPSKFEAGATVILEAMSYGLPVIARNSGGLLNAINDDNFLCNSENEMFKKLLEINNTNYENISKKNILKIKTHNNQKNLLEQLFNELQFINTVNEINSIPNIIHYVYGLKKQTEEFPFVYYLSILSNHIINKPLKIYFHYQYLPYGKWWDNAQKLVSLNYINCAEMYWGDKKIIKYAHKADKIRLEMLLKYGGIYMDIDTITYRPYNDLLKYDFVMGIQEENYGNDKNTLLCNAILFSKKNSIFIKKWIKQYEEHFIPDGWCEASVHLPYKIYSSLFSEVNNTQCNIKILEKECFYYPLYNEVNKIFEENEDIHEKLITLHYWNSFSNKYYENINDFYWMDNNNSLYAKIMKHLFSLINL